MSGMHIQTAVALALWAAGSLDVVALNLWVVPGLLEAGEDSRAPAFSQDAGPGAAQPLLAQVVPAPAGEGSMTPVLDAAVEEQPPTAAVVVAAAAPVPTPSVQAEARVRRAPPVQAEAIPQKEYMVFFDFESYKLRPDATTVLEHLVRDVKSLGSVEMEIAGHADAVGLREANHWFSVARAETVRKALIQRGVRLQKVTVTGFGATQPRVAGTTRGPVAENRRVEIIMRGVTQ